MLDGCFCFSYGILSEREYTKAHSSFGHNYSQNHTENDTKKIITPAKQNQKAKERHPKHRKEIGNGLQKDGYFVPLLDAKIFPQWEDIGYLVNSFIFLSYFISPPCYFFFYLEKNLTESWETGEGRNTADGKRKRAKRESREYFTLYMACGVSVLFPSCQENVFFSSSLFLLFYIDRLPFSLPCRPTYLPYHCLPPCYSIVTPTLFSFLGLYPFLSPITIYFCSVPFNTLLLLC